MDPSVLIDLAKAPGAKLILNNLVASPSNFDLDQDLVLVELPGGIFIDVSWSPEHESAGAYHVTIFRHGDWDHPLDSAEARTPQRAALLVGMMAERHARRVVPIHAPRTLRNALEVTVFGCIIVAMACAPWLAIIAKDAFIWVWLKIRCP
jgi:hypothetical protein